MEQEWINPLDETYEEVNKLILLGNGFDLAHNMDTSFNSFISNELDKLIHTITEFLIHPQGDPIFQNEYCSFMHDTEEIYWGKMLRRKTHPSQILFNKFTSCKSFQWNNSLYKAIFESRLKKKWVDIEILYFDQLLESQKSNSSENAEQLNKSFDLIRSRLMEYLKGIDTPVNPSPKILEQFQEMISWKHCMPDTLQEESFRSAKNLYFLNFNYTSSAELYMAELGHETSSINYIHGSLAHAETNSQPPIFGFGDELDRDYKKFEDSRENILFEHIKSFKYLESDNYRKLMDFIESIPFQICIFGHSCGVSDRTLLNTLFEHENCISIKQYYHDKGNGQDDYTEKNYSIARNFNDKKMLRDKVVNYKYCSPMAQPSGSE